MKKLILITSLIMSFNANCQQIYNTEFDGRFDKSIWKQNDDEKVYAGIKDGIYRIDNYGYENGITITKGDNNLIDHNKEFVLKVNLKFVYCNKCDMNTVLGFTFGYKDIYNYNAIYIYPDIKKFKIVQFKNGNESEIKELTFLSEINGINEFNEIKIQQMNNLTAFYINNKFAFSNSPKLTWFSNNDFGFQVFQNQGIEIKSIYCNYY